MCQLPLPKVPQLSDLDVPSTRKKCESLPGSTHPFLHWASETGSGNSPQTRPRSVLGPFGAPCHSGNNQRRWISRELPGP